MNCIVSVIVPIYNAENYLYKCITSIQNQNYEHLEIILINDGSTDSSLDICKRFKEEDKRVVLIDVENGGVSKSRNIGIDVSTGEFIVFVDSDDWIEPQYVEHLLNINFQNTDYLVACGWTKETSQGKFIKEVIKEDRISLNVNEMLRRYGKNAIGFTTIMYPRGVIIDKGIRFDEYAKVAEDTLFVINCILEMKGLIYDPKPFYHIVQSDDSITRSTLNANHISGVDTYDKIIEILQSNYKHISNNFELIKYQYITNIMMKLVEKDPYPKESALTKDDLMNYLKKNVFCFLLSSRISLKAKIRSVFIVYGWNVMFYLRQ